MNNTDWDDAFSNARYIKGGAQYAFHWAKEAEIFRSATQSLAQVDLIYEDQHDRCRYDIFYPSRSNGESLVFLHGGYWIEFDKSFWSHLAVGPLSEGYTVVIPSYPLAPESSLMNTFFAVSNLVKVLAKKEIGPITLTGHSAGAHLALGLVSSFSPFSQDVKQKIKRVVGISGIYDLEPLIWTALNEKLRLDANEAKALSPFLAQPPISTEVLVCVGALERPEFRRQTQLLFDAWKEKGGLIKMQVMDARHHFDILNEFNNPRSGWYEKLD